MKKTLRMTALFLAMVLSLTAVVTSWVSAETEQEYDEETNPDGYACKIVSADGTTTTYYKYFSPMDAVKVDENTTQSAYLTEKGSNTSYTADTFAQAPGLCAVSNVDWAPLHGL